MLRNAAVGAGRRKRSGEPVMRRPPLRERTRAPEGARSPEHLLQHLEEPPFEQQKAHRIRPADESGRGLGACREERADGSEEKDRPERNGESGKAAAPCPGGGEHQVHPSAPSV